MTLIGTAYSSGYVAGGYLAVLILGLLAALLLKRVIRPAAVVTTVEPSFGPESVPYAPALGGAGSVAPPGFAAAPLAAAAPSAYVAPPPSEPRTVRKAKTSDIVALAICLVLLTGAIVHAHGLTRRYDSLPSGFRSENGDALHQGFMKSCAQGGAGAFCECAFTRMAAIPPYTTPEGFIALAPVFASAEMSGTMQNVPPVIVSAIHECRLSAPIA